MRDRLIARLQLEAAKHGEPFDRDHPMWGEMVDAVLLTLREPTEAMLLAAREVAKQRVIEVVGVDGPDDLKYIDAEEVDAAVTGNHRAMIDAALH